MHVLREVLNQKIHTNQSNNRVAKNLGVSHTYVNRKIKRYKKLGLSWEDIKKMNDAELDGVFHGREKFTSGKRMPDWYQIHQKMQIPHMTLTILHQEYRAENPEDAYGFSQFCYYYNEYIENIDISMRQIHHVAEVIYVDFAGQTMSYKNKKTGESHKAQVFVGVLGYSKYISVIAVASQKIEDWVNAINALFYSLGGVTQILVCDNLKAAIIKAGLDPIINKIFLEQAIHFNFVIIPARVREPQDKSLAEGGVSIVESNIIARLHGHQFFSLEEINKAISKKLIEINEKPFQDYPGCRRSRFEELDKPLLKPLPPEPFEYAEWTALQTVRKDYHVKVKDHFYSVPYALVGKKVEARCKSATVDIIHLNQCIATHIRSDEKGGATTNPAHQSNAHRAYSEHTEENMLAWAKKVGKYVLVFTEDQFKKKKHSRLALQACSSLKNLARRYGEKRLESACKFAVKEVKSSTIKSLKSILSSNLDQVDFRNIPAQIKLPFHHNIRGSEYYSNKEA